MKKILITTIAFLLLLTSCSGTSNKYEAQVAQLESEIEVLQSQVKELQQSRTTEPSVSTTTNRVTEPIKTQQEATTTTEAMAGLITEKHDINKFFILEDEDDKIELRLNTILFAR